MSHKTVNAVVAYQLTPNLRFTLDGSNIFNEQRVFSRGNKDRTQRTLINFVTLTAGVNGRF